ncbi:glutaredoxin family protein [Aneurinibacillus sp. Ricciae_BoGa-3]|uniref:glutaredoxin family protein n=1 Tax=Aneurinibacillus sp. Ricciae_BoGa-3 TaxID=3022697 RepID=UPI00234211D0|nr:glutaredoxin family protein [Aneurinibacillus sp. Ricciae_BoGa-3]WCK54122.1 glutaredoxin family protein [Aneurinibacillus sp. Ricciae_BoGa-3]
MDKINKKIVVTIYTRKGCGLCEEAKEKVLCASREFPIQLEVVDIAQDPLLVLEYDLYIPVVFIDGEKAFVSRMDEKWLYRELEIRSRKQVE